jgi:AbrB family looped-hinge helix DNA binding protein
MKILKVKSRKYKGTQYHKYRINIPKEVLDSAGFQEGDELKAEAKKGEIMLRKGKS